jgi:two-component system response regulator NreC
VTANAASDGQGGGTIRVLLADDHTILRQGVRLLLESQPDIEVVGEAATGEEAVRLAVELQPDVAVVDVTMPDGNGIAATHRIRAQAPAVRVLVLTMHDRPDYAEELLTAGAVGYVLKSSAPDQLVRAVRSVAQGALVFAPDHANPLLTQTAERPGSLRRLTAREEEVLRLAAQGLHNDAIAEELGVSVKTVETHRSHIMEKLGLHDRVDLVRYAVRHGLCDL